MVWTIPIIQWITGQNLNEWLMGIEGKIVFLMLFLFTFTALWIYHYVGEKKWAHFSGLWLISSSLLLVIFIVR